MPLFSFPQLYCPMRIFWWEIWVASPPRKATCNSQVTQPTVPAVCFCISVIIQTLTWTTGSVTSAQIMHVVAHGGCTDIVRESLHCKLTLGQKFLAKLGNRTCVSGMPVWCSTKWATFPLGCIKQLTDKAAIETKQLDHVMTGWGCWRQQNTNLRWVTGMVARRFSGPMYLVWMTRSSEEYQMMENCFRRLDCPWMVQATSTSPNVRLSRSSWWIKLVLTVSRKPETRTTGCFMLVG